MAELAIIKIKKKKQRMKKKKKKKKPCPLYFNPNRPRHTKLRLARAL